MLEDAEIEISNCSSDQSLTRKQTKRQRFSIWKLKKTPEAQAVKILYTLEL